MCKRSCVFISRMSTPPMLIAPESISQKRPSKLTRVILPPPEGPTSAVSECSGMCSVMPFTIQQDRKILLNGKRRCVRKHQRCVVQHKSCRSCSYRPESVACKGCGVYGFFCCDDIAHDKEHHNVRHKADEGAQAGEHKGQRQKSTVVSRIA